mmetsp:Transcript_105478/g.265675  ORF Transcript_105478/g.265675 Transcript_105478/m.265675 type:complete len:250 (-) Transcript_105478:2346-3095(-)
MASCSLSVKIFLSSSERPFHNSASLPCTGPSPLRSGFSFITSARFSLKNIIWALLGFLGASFMYFILAIPTLFLLSKAAMSLMYFLPASVLLNSFSSSWYFLSASWNFASLSFFSSSGTSRQAVCSADRSLPLPACSLHQALKALAGFSGMPSGFGGGGGPALALPLPLPLPLALPLGLTAFWKFFQFSESLNAFMASSYSFIFASAASSKGFFSSSGMASQRSWRTLRISKPFISGLAFCSALKLFSK